jgi:predicted nucleic acid-binding protein
LILLDTNIFMYAVGRPHPYKEPCQKILQAIGAGAVDFNTDAEVLQELLYVYSLKGQREKGIWAVEKVFIISPNPSSITRLEVNEAKELMKKYPVLLPRDAIHAGVIIAQGYEGILSADSNFDLITETKRYDPTKFAESL